MKLDIKSETSIYVSACLMTIFLYLVSKDFSYGFALISLIPTYSMVSYAKHNRINSGLLLVGSILIITQLSKVHTFYESYIFILAAYSWAFINLLALMFLYFRYVEGDGKHNAS